MVQQRAEHGSVFDQYKVDLVYRDPHRFGGGALIFATVAFAFQIYCDFSGYSDIAIGAARTMGFTLMLRRAGR